MFTLQQAAEDQVFTFAPVSLQYIALIPLNNYGGTAFGLNEFEVYAVKGKRPQPVKPIRFGELASTEPLTTTAQTG